MHRDIVARKPQQNQYPPAHWRQLELFPLPQKRQKPQIVSVPGTSIRERDRYRVMVGDRILGDRLTLDEALNSVKRGES